MAALTIRLLGGMTLEHAGSVVELARPRSMALLAYLLLHRDGPHPRSRLAYLLWPDSDGAQARTNLRHLLYHVRRSLPDPERFLTLDGQRIHWRPDAPADLDVDRFEEALARAERAEDVSVERVSLEAAGRLYRGDLLPEMFDDWLGEARERLRDRRARALQQLITIAERQRDDGAALLHTRQLVHHDPLAEGSYRRLMRLQARIGERAKAMHTYHSCASMLQRELGVAARVRIRRAEPYPEGAAPPPHGRGPRGRGKGGGERADRPSLRTGRSHPGGRSHTSSALPRRCRPLRQRRRHRVVTDPRRRQHCGWPPRATPAATSPPRASAP